MIDHTHLDGDNAGGFRARARLPSDLRRSYPFDTGRLRRMIGVAAEGINWGRPMPQGSGLGIAGHYSFVSYVAVAAEVRVDGPRLTIPRVDIAIDCGPHVNPERIRSQMESAVIMGVGLATSAEISFKDGRVEQNNFDTYELTRIDTAPRDIRVHLVTSRDYHQPLVWMNQVFPL